MSEAESGKTEEQITTKTFRIQTKKPGSNMVSVIVPFVNEWPSLVFTLQALYEELKDRSFSFEVIAVDNWCDEVERKQLREPDRGHRIFTDKALMKGLPWLRILKYKGKLSHWQCKNFAAECARGNVFLFCDAHCLPSRNSLANACKYYIDHHEGLNGSLHLPLTYSIIEHRVLMYRLVAKPEKGVLHYKFCSFDSSKIIPFTRPCMSTCGMIVSRQIYDDLGGWPKELGIYGGGENFWNWAMAVTGRNVWLMPGGPLRHHGDKRGYNWNYDDYHRNRLLATYVTLGKVWAERYAKNAIKGSPRRTRILLHDVLNTCENHRSHIRERTSIDIDEWISKWSLIS